jgi:hypothetical protein
MQGLFDAMLFFNLDLDMMQFQCWQNLSWETMFMVQVFLVPVLLLLLALGHLTCSYAFKVLNDYNYASCLLRLGWRPRRDFSLESILFSYGPTYVLYINAYYITGIQVALKPLLCVGDAGETYLKYSPEIACWESMHLRILVWAGVAITIYFVLFPGVIAYVLFVLVPRHGHDNERLNVAFGFLWSRFEERVWWWEIVRVAWVRSPI